MVHGRVVRVPLVGGESPTLLDAPQVSDSCEAMRAGGEVLIVCPDEGYVLARDGSSRITIDKKLGPGIFFASSGGALAYAGPCSAAAERDPGVACVRSVAGVWTEQSVGDDEVVRWIPRPDGSVAALAGGGADLVVGDRRIALEDREQRALGGYVRLSGEPSFDRSFTVDDESIRRLGGGELVTLTLTGTRTLERVEGAAGAWPHVLRWKKETEELWQSDDEGRTWAVTRGTPVKFERPTHCSDAGCKMGGWLRIGWQTVPPEPTARSMAAPVSIEPRGDRPTYACKVRGDAGAIGGFSDDDAHVTGRLHHRPRVHLSSDGERTEVLSTPPFDVRGTVRRERLGVAPPGRNVRYETLLPVVGHGERDPTWWIWWDDSLVKAGPTAALWPADPWMRYLDGAVSHRSGDISILVDGRLHRVSRTESRFVAFAGAAHTIALAPDGEAALVYLPMGSPPDDDQQAFVWAAGEEPIALAPWSSLRPADEERCKDGSEDYRMTVQPSGTWLGPAEVPDWREDSADEAMLLVRWNEERVCLEAAEVPTGVLRWKSPDALSKVVAEHDGPRRVRGRIVMRFSRPRTAALLAHESGFGVRQPLICRLGHAPR